MSLFALSCLENLEAPSPDGGRSHREKFLPRPLHECIHWFYDIVPEKCDPSTMEYLSKLKEASSSVESTGIFVDIGIGKKDI